MEKEILDILKEMNSSLFNLENEIKNMKSEITDIKIDIRSFEDNMNEKFNWVNNRLDTISTGIGDVIGNEVGDSLSNNLTEIKDDIKFIKHKLHSTEEDVYKIQSHLKIIK